MTIIVTIIGIICTYLLNDIKGQLKTLNEDNTKFKVEFQSVQDEIKHMKSNCKKHKNETFTT